MTPWYKQHPDLYMILIADQRSVLFIIEDRTDMVYEELFRNF